MVQNEIPLKTTIDSFNKSPKFDIVKKTQSILQAKGFSHVYSIRGDGNCFIRCLVIYLWNSLNKNLFFDTFSSFIDLDKLLKFIEHGLSEHVLEFICIKIRSNVQSKWDYHDIPIECQMDENAICGKAQEMVMRILGVERFTGYSLIPDSNESIEFGHLVDKSMLFFNSGTHHIHLLCEHGRNHFSLLKMLNE